LSVTKYIDKSSAHLVLAVLNGTPFKEATLTVRKAGESPVNYLKITISPVLVTNVSPGGSGGEDRLTESVTLNFAKVCYTYTPQKEDGSADAEIRRCFNIEANIEQ
jgi:type VI secretion system secreted protein Hcp